MYCDKQIAACLTIAGSDCSGGAGVAADLKTFSAHGVYGMSVLCALTAQNTKGVAEIFPVPAAFVRAQLDAVFTDIFPQGVKIGMLPGAGAAREVQSALCRYRPQNVVVDPVLFSTSGKCLAQDVPAVCALFPFASLVTPNLAEAERLCGMEIANKRDMERACRIFYEKFGAPVLLKGGHLPGAPDDALFDGETLTWFSGSRVKSQNTHGTGCTLSSAVCALLAKGLSLPEAVQRAKAYVAGAISFGLNLGAGNGPLYHEYLQKQP